MLDPKIIEEMNAKMSSFLATGPVKDIEKNTKAMLTGLFAKLDLVPREEFEIQKEMLARTREKLKALEARVEALERARQGD